jgi:glycosyltransferase involved in cell wall biosynthesis
MKIAWNGIVKNEEAVIERCVRSLLPHVDYAIVVDTGSEDRTPEKISRLFADARKPFELHYAPFENFSQARNVALQRARESALDWEYLLLCDADMELLANNSSWTKKLNGGPAYDLRQVGGTLGYYNKRLVSRQATGNYEGVTHEYLDITSAGAIDDVYFLDHADGANRPDKTARDIALLEAALRTETRPGLIERYTFYLAQSYCDAGRWADAIPHYKRRVELGGYEEERWYAQYKLACCYGYIGDHPNFVWAGIRAFEMRPQRAEMLYELAKFFRVRGDNFTSLLFSEAGLRMLHPKDDRLFVDERVYSHGMREEFAVCGYYSPKHYTAAAKETNRLALDGNEQARNNLYWYLKSLADAVPSFKPQQIKFEAPAGYVPCNPSMIAYGEDPLFLVRTVNYTINADGGYDIRDGNGACSDRNAIHTRNFIVRSHHSVGSELSLPVNSPATEYPLVRGLEDSRLFEWADDIWTISTAREWNSEGWCEQVLAPIIDGGYGSGWNKILPKERRHEKNWMPWVKDGELRFVYRLGHLIDTEGKDVCRFACDFDASCISGGSQVVWMDEQTWLAVVHEARTIPGRPNRFYQHRFVTFRANGRVDRISAPFFFQDRQIEFCAGLAYFPEKRQLMVSYGVRDCEAWTATMDPQEVLRFVYQDAL